jgi:hypothetical protein
MACRGFVLGFLVAVLGIIFFMPRGVVIVVVIVALAGSGALIGGLWQLVRAFRDPICFISPAREAPVEIRVAHWRRRKAAVLVLAAGLCLTIIYVLSWPLRDLPFVVIALGALGWDLKHEEPPRIFRRPPTEEYPPLRCGQCGITLCPGRHSCHWCGWKPDGSGSGSSGKS